MTCFGLLGLHQVAKFYETKYIVADVEISSSGQNLYMKYKLCMSKQVRRYPRWGSSPLGSVVVGVWGVEGRVPDGELAGLNASHLRER
jgi:hypothetical protein